MSTQASKKNKRTRALYALCAFFLIALCSCGDKDSDVVKENGGYKESIEELIMRHTTLEGLQKYTGVDKKILVGIAMDVYQENDDKTITKELQILCNAFSEDEVKANELMSQSLLLKYGNKKKTKTVLTTDSIEMQNQRFQEALQDFTASYYADRTESFVSDRFSLLSIPGMIWDGLFADENDILNEWQSDLTSELNAKEVAVVLNDRVDAYNDYLAVQGLLAHTKTPRAKMVNVEDDVKISHNVLPLITERMHNEVYSSLWLVLLELFIGFVIVLIIRSIYNRQMEETKQIWNFYNNKVSKSGGGVLKKIGKYALGALCFGSSINEIKRRRDSKLRKMSMILTVLFVVLSFFLFDYQSGKLEEQITSQVYECVSDYLSQQNLSVF